MKIRTIIATAVTGTILMAAGSSLAFGADWTCPRGYGDCTSYEYCTTHDHGDCDGHWSEEGLSLIHIYAYKNLYGNERIGAAATEEMRKARPLTDKWTFSTNGVSIMGRNGIPCIGFGPGAEAQAHAPNEITWKQDLVTCAAVYAALPAVYCK